MLQELPPKFDLTGCWLLDPRRSDSLEEILKYHDVPWHLRKVARRVVPTVYMKQAPGQLLLMNVTSLRTIKESWIIDNKKHEAETGRGTIYYSCRFGEDGQSLITTTSCKKPTDTEETVRSLAENGKVLVLHIRIWSHYEDAEKKKEILKMTRIFDRVETKEDPWASPNSPTPLADTMPLVKSPSDPSNKALKDYQFPKVDPTQPPSPTSPTNPTPAANYAALTSTPETILKGDVTPYEVFLTKVFYPNHLAHRPGHVELYKQARELMTSIDRMFIVLVIGLVILHFFKRT
jgi:hypothetical protein